MFVFIFGYFVVYLYIILRNTLSNNFITGTIFPYIRYIVFDIHSICRIRYIDISLILSLMYEHFITSRNVEVQLFRAKTEFRFYFETWVIWPTCVVLHNALLLPHCGCLYESMVLQMWSRNPSLGSELFSLFSTMWQTQHNFRYSVCVYNVTFIFPNFP